MRLFITTTMVNGAVYTPLHQMLGIHPNEVPGALTYQTSGEASTSEEFGNLLRQHIETLTELPARYEVKGGNFTISMLEFSDDKDREYSLKTLAARDESTIEGLRAFELSQVAGMQAAWPDVQAAIEYQTMDLRLQIEQDGSSLERTYDPATV